MANDCILETCIYCDEFVWEDEYYGFTKDMNFLHKDCKNKYSHNELLEIENKKLKRKIAELERKIGGNHGVYK
ncbi:hypothetical protein [Clostridium sp. FP1]|uniref:hypothetical protein n=1 Tax=Clostridium sp. FP1 TaxID=2724076 RepID=UPI0013E9315F|nr:hypothetical protein [Clostridium sp. FP1]MBZ9635611.1 hypothetical protein [Clostridium sp. FP1]